MQRRRRSHSQEREEGHPNHQMRHHSHQEVPACSCLGWKLSLRRPVSRAKGALLEKESSSYEFMVLIRYHILTSVAPFVGVIPSVGAGVAY